ncbi:4Fe-4S ferredoxin [Gordonibacter sp. An230]|uniref:4Fe-4S dicluster domain-containing protein n=1 Tax=Gordonibacter sp. An230 TaxID=1965592 RepID=UPI000B39EAD9|nr:4Fe-4S dicluster domain-containing protein [Gordonibacter sp. An230]OUO91453.1 4Fe-4S ferredoxin [Gordonibacter sp. An230]
MARYAIITDLNRCTGCLACSVACKVVNNVPIGNYWNKVMRIGPNPKWEGAQNPDVELYFLPVTCQHCADPECVKVCPTGASRKLEDGTVQVDKSKCIGCQFCAMACPYNVRYLNEEEGVVEKCTLCEQKVAQGELPQCVAQCGGRARWFGDLDEGIESFEAPADWIALEEDLPYGSERPYEAVTAGRVRLSDFVDEFTESDVHHLTDVGNKPSCAYILRGKTWQGRE